MVDAAFSHQRRLEDLSISGGRQRRIFAIVVGLTLVGLGGVLVQRGWKPDSAVGKPVAGTVSSEQVRDLLEATKGLQVTQQQAVDQLQIVQDQLLAQKAETKKLSEQIAIMTEKLEALQQSGADTSATSANDSAPVSSPKAHR